MSSGGFAVHNSDVDYCSSLLSKVWKSQSTLLNSFSGWQLHESIEIINWSIKNCHSISIGSVSVRLDNLIEDTIACVSSDVPLCKGVKSFKLNVVSSIKSISGGSWTGWEIDVISVNGWIVLACVSASWNITNCLLKGL